MSSNSEKSSKQQPLSNWNLIYGYSQTANKSYPYRALDSDLRSSLAVTFKVSTADMDHLCSGGPQGFIVAPHPPNERPQMYKRYFYVPLEQAVLLSIEPSLMRNVRKVREQNLNVRKCYLNSERHLRFFKHYTEFNCKMECLQNFTQAKCGCVKYSMLRTLNSNMSIKIIFRTVICFLCPF